MRLCVCVCVCVCAENRFGKNTLLGALKKLGLKGGKDRSTCRWYACRFGVVTGRNNDSGHQTRRQRRATTARYGCRREEERKRRGLHSHADAVKNGRYGRAKAAPRFKSRLVLRCGSSSP